MSDSNHIDSNIFTFTVNKHLAFGRNRVTGTWSLTPGRWHGMLNLNLDRDARPELTVPSGLDKAMHDEAERGELDDIEELMICTSS